MQYVTLLNVKNAAFLIDKEARDKSPARPTLSASALDGELGDVQSANTSENNVTRRLRPIAQNVDTILSLGLELNVSDLSEVFGKPVLRTGDVVPLDSPGELAQNHLYRWEQGLIVHSLEDVSINDIPIAEFIAERTALNALNEFTLLTALRALQKQGSSRILLLCDPQTQIPAWAVMQRLKREPDWTISFGLVADPKRIRGIRHETPQLGWQAEFTKHISREWAMHKTRGSTFPAINLPITPAEAAAAMHAFSGTYSVAPAASNGMNSDKSARKNLFFRPRHIEEGSVVTLGLSNNPLYYTHTIPVMRELMNRGVPVYALVLPPGRKDLLTDALGEDRVFEMPPLAMLQKQKTFVEKVNRIATAVSARLALLYAEKSGTRAWSHLGLLRQTTLLTSMVRQCAVIGIFLDSAAKRLKPRSLLLPTAVGTGIGEAVATAHAHGIPIVMGHAATIAGRIRSLPAIRPDVHLAAYGQHVVDIMRNRGYASETFVHVTGSPALDSVYQIDADANRREFMDQYEIDRHTTIVAVLTTRNDQELEDSWLLPLAEWFSANSNFVMLVKPHPSKRIDLRNLELRIRNGLTGTYIKNGDPGWAIGRSDIVVTDNSTVGLLAFSLGRQMIQVNSTGTDYPYNDYVGMGCAYGATNVHEITTIIERLAKPTKSASTMKITEKAVRSIPAEMMDARMKFLDQYNAGHDGKAASRVADLVEQPPPSLAPYTNPFHELLARGPEIDEEETAIPVISKLDFAHGFNPELSVMAESIAALQQVLTQQQALLEQLKRQQATKKPPNTLASAVPGTLASAVIRRLEGHPGSFSTLQLAKRRLQTVPVVRTIVSWIWNKLLRL